MVQLLQCAIVIIGFQNFTTNIAIYEIKFERIWSKQCNQQNTINCINMMNMVFNTLLYSSCKATSAVLKTLRPRQNRRHFADDIFTYIFLNENVWIPIKISLKFVSKSPINNIPALVQIMAWRRPGDKPLSEPMMFSLTTHTCVTRPQWVKYTFHTFT